MSPWFGGMKPEITPNRVVLPAPFGPIKPVIRPSSAAIDTPSTARTPPNRRVRFETTRSGSALRYLPPPALEAASRSGDDADQAARRKGDDEHQHATVDDEVKTWRIARDVRRRLAERLDHQRAHERPEHRTCAANDRRQQRLDRHARTVGDACIEEEKILRVKAAGSRGDRRRARHCAAHRLE